MMLSSIDPCGGRLFPAGGGGPERSCASREILLKANSIKVSILTIWGRI